MRRRVDGIRRTALLFALAVPAVAWPASAASEVDESLSIESQGAVRVDLPYGDVRIEGSDEQRVVVRGTIDERLAGLVVEREAGAVEIRPELSLFDRFKALVSGAAAYPVDVVISVPYDVRLFVVSRDASIAIDDVTGPIGIGVVSSTATVRSDPNRLVYEAVSGSLDFEGTTARLSASSLSGALKAVGRVTKLTLETGTGSLDVAARELESGKLTTVSGDVTVCGALSGRGSLDLRTESGDVTLAFESAEGLAIGADTRDGEILNELNDVAPQREVNNGHRTLQLAPTVSGDEASVKVRTRTGLIRLEAPQGGRCGGLDAVAGVVRSP